MEVFYPKTLAIGSHRLFGPRKTTPGLFNYRSFEIDAAWEEFLNSRNADGSFDQDALSYLSHYGETEGDNRPFTLIVRVQARALLGLYFFTTFDWGHLNAAEWNADLVRPWMHVLWTEEVKLLEMYFQEALYFIQNPIEVRRLLTMLRADIDMGLGLQPKLEIVDVLGSGSNIPMPMDTS